MKNDIIFSWMVWQVLYLALGAENSLWLQFDFDLVSVMFFYCVMKCNGEHAQYLKKKAKM